MSCKERKTYKAGIDMYFVWFDSYYLPQYKKEPYDKRADIILWFYLSP